MSIRFDDVGDRLRAYRLASGLRPEEIAARVGISRAALYRYERGEIAKIEPLERFAELYAVSLPTLLGVGVEYVASPVAYFERMRQLEAEAHEVVAYFLPVSYLLTSEAYEATLRTMLLESLPAGLPDRPRAAAEVERVMAVLAARKETFRTRRPRVRTLMGTSEITLLLRDGLVGHADLDAVEARRRRCLAEAEVLHIARLLESPPPGIEGGVVVDNTPGTSFQLLRAAGRTTLCISPFRLGVHPNVRVGVALITTAPEAIALHETVAEDLWARALKGPEAARLVLDLVARHGAGD